MTGVTLHGVVSPERRNSPPGRDAIETIAEALGSHTEEWIRHVRPVSTSGGREYRGTSLIRNCHPHRTTAGPSRRVLLSGPRRGQFFMNEVPLYGPSNSKTRSDRTPVCVLILRPRMTDRILESSNKLRTRRPTGLCVSREV